MTTTTIDFDEFLNGYITAALWSSTDEDGEPLDTRLHDMYGDFDPLDVLSPHTLELAKTDCRGFIDANLDDLVAAGPLGSYATRSAQWSVSELAGHDFWLTRNGHGAGFWDRGLGEVGERLSEAARIYGTLNLLFGDDGTIDHF